ncbi:uncharacterized protein F5891DRAFT_978263 [Suillus fuscotomentosus]|uniref:Uncharacterized protein n=1 Tax=Suillus fuscotomentosus TaxID=1912939 RepID=A0AAD4HN61_9AGAM|nr:uncharacterized protein F5891DRAFT_978263 [Suillus fuscotomentosus]KAG1902773.1 hypothetical protein F5891DRAFT_978263 [Suillus fuscotomentosus]
MSKDKAYQRRDHTLAESRTQLQHHWHKLRLKSDGYGLTSQLVMRWAWPEALRPFGPSPRRSGQSQAQGKGLAFYAPPNASVLMPPTVISDDDTPVTVTMRAKRTIISSSCLTDSNNTATPELSSHKISTNSRNAGKRTLADADWTPSSREELAELSSEEDKAAGHKGKHLCRAHNPSFMDDTRSLIDDTEETPSTRHTTPAATDEFLSDINVQDISMTPVLRHEERGSDVSAFFGKPYAHKAKDGKTRSV